MIGVAEIRLQLKENKFGLFKGAARNEFLIRVHPEDKITFKTNNKIPGLECKLGTAELDLSYKVYLDVVLQLTCSVIVQGKSSKSV
jgi:glucose-6-phosphate 1-dehydrogenase